jgi:hypothetical protein
MPDEHLSTALFRETRGTGFFRVLAGKTRLLMSMNGLERESSYRPDGIAREESIPHTDVITMAARAISDSKVQRLNINLGWLRNNQTF